MFADMMRYNMDCQNTYVSLLCLKGVKRNQTEHLIFGKRNKVTKFAKA